MKGVACAGKLNFLQSANDPFGVILGPEREGQAFEELSVHTLRDMTRQFHLVVLRGFVSGFHDAGVLTRYAQSWGDIMLWPFGAVLDVVAREDATDHIFDTSHVPLHWDGMYRETVPEFQLFHCVGAPLRSERGRTLFTDTVGLLADTDARRLEEWKGISVTYRIARAAHYGGEIRSPLIVPHPVTGAPTLRYNEPAIEGGVFLNRHRLEHHGLDPSEVAGFQHLLHRRLHSDRYLYAHRWMAGDVVIADNFALLHGREGFRNRSTRHLQRVHIQGSPACVNHGLRDLDRTIADAECLK